MGALTLKPKQGILIDGRKFKDGSNLLRKSTVTVKEGSKPKQGVRLAVRIGEKQDILEFKLGESRIDMCPRDPEGEAQLQQQDGAVAEKWIAWQVPRELLPTSLGGFKTTFRLARPTGVQSVKWAVVYDDEPFSGGYVIFGTADVGWHHAERPKAKPRRLKPRRPKRKR